MMKLYPKQSVCPHCRTVYRYADVRELMWKKKTACYHCRKEFAVKRRSLWLLALEMTVIYALLNLLMIGVIQGISLLGMFLINMLPALAAVWLMPYYVELKKIQSKDKKK